MPLSALSQDVLDRVPRPRLGLARNLAIWVVLLCVGVLFSPTLASLGRVWIHSIDYQHGFLVGVLSIGLLFRARSQLEVALIRPTPIALPALALALLGWLTAYRGNSEMLQQIAFPVVAWLSLLAAMGPAVARVVAFPIGYFYFALPIWDQLTPLLQWLSTQVSEGTLGLLGVPTQVEGFNVTIPEGNFSIVEGCSGKRYFVIALALAALAGFLQGVRGRRFVLLLAIAAGSALITNWIRIVIVIYAGHLSNMQHYLVATEHLSLGYALYVPLLAMTVFSARHLASVSAGSDMFVQSNDTSLGSVLRGLAGPAVLLLSAAIFLLKPAAPAASNLALGAAPLLTGHWQGPLPPRSEWQPHFAGALREFRASYVRDDRRVEIYANVYGVQAPGQELVHFENSVVPSPPWTVIRRLEAELPFEMLIASREESRWVVARTHVIGRRLTASPGIAQLRYGWSALWRPVPSGVLAVATPCDGDCEAAGATLTSYWNEHGEDLMAMIPGRL